MALIARVPMPNLVRTGFGTVNNFLPTINTNSNSGSLDTVGEGARALCFLFDGDLLRQMNSRFLLVAYSVNWRQYSSSANAGMQGMGRVVVVRNVPPTLNPLTFDPYLTDKTPGITLAPTSPFGSNWGAPRFDWEAGDILFDCYIGIDTNTRFSNKQFKVGVPRLNFAQDNILVVMTPFYINDQDWPEPVGDDPKTGWVGAGFFAGTPPNTTQNQLRQVSRALSVYGEC